MKVTEDPNSMFLYQNYNEIPNSIPNNKINNINDLNEYDYESYPNNQKMQLNNQLEDMYQEGGDMDDQIQSYKEQLIDAKLKNIKLTNEVQKLKELSRTQSQFYGGSNQEEMDPQNQTDSMFYKSNNQDNYVKQIEKYEKKMAKYHEKIKALKDHNSKLEDLVLKLKDTLDRANEVFPNFLMQLSNNANNNNEQNTNNKKENALMVSVGEDPINAQFSNENNVPNSKIMEENRQLGAENLELKNALTQLEEELENMKSDRNMLGNDFDNKLKLIQKEMENTNKKNEQLLNDKIREFNEDLAQKKKIIEDKENYLKKIKEAYKNENDKLKKENQKYLIQIKSLNDEAQQHVEEIGVLEEQIKNNEYLLKDKDGKENIIQQLNSEIEQYKIENEEIINETNTKIEEYENKIKEISE